MNMAPLIQVGFWCGDVEETMDCLPTVEVFVRLYQRYTNFSPANGW